ncbi:MAG: hypothetical protein IPK80_35010 [Nannocystis sp.]|nr:hypothetical protein [Nannocystis sp.]
MGHSVIIRSSADLWDLLSALGPGDRHRRLRIDTAIKLFVQLATAYASPGAA